MADRRRRRRRASQDSDDDDDESASGSESPKSGSQTSKSRGPREPEPPETATERTEAKEEVQSECESEDGVGEAVLSDYESADPEENGSRSEGAEEEEDDDGEGYSDEEAAVVVAAEAEIPAPVQQEQVEDDEDGDEPSKEEEEEESEEKAKSAGERQSGDGQESTVDPESKAGVQPGQRLDDDEDRKNPAYIPRKGLFFEHDVRGHTQEDERPKGRNRKLWKDQGRWEHDKFREEEQAPKSREELISAYGYDIRNGERGYGQRRPRPATSPNREQQRWREGGERAPRSWQSSRGGRGGGPPRGGPPHHASPASTPQAYGQRDAATYRGRGPRHPARHASESQVPQRALPKGSPEPAADGGRVAEDPPLGKSGPGREASPDRRGGAPSARLSHAPVSPGEASPPAERPVERKSYSLARRSRSRPSEPGGKRAVSTEEAAIPEDPAAAAGAEELERDVARLTLVSGRTWNQSPTSYVHPEMRGLHVAGGPPPSFSGLEEMSGGANRAKRYSSQRQRGVTEAPPPLHVGVMEGHFYEPMTYPAPMYTHGDAAAPIPPQGMLVQPEMHIPHPGLHAHQSGGPIANPALYGGPPVSLSPGQPQPLLPPPFYPPPGVMTFPYPTMYPSPQGQSQVTYGGVTYYDTMQQQAQPKPSPPRRTSQPVTVKPPPPEVPFASE